jgi:hypothetical protein
MLFDSLDQRSIEALGSVAQVLTIQLFLCRSRLSYSDELKK